MNSSKNKGKVYERIVADHLSKITNLSFLRVPNSGAYVGKSNFFRTEHLSPEQIGMFEGDIITPKEWNHVRIECKWYKDFGWHQLFDASGEPTLNKWIAQAETGTRPYWFLCFKINRAGEFVVYGESLFKYISQFPVFMEYSPTGSNKRYRISSMTNFFEINNAMIFGLREGKIQNDTNIRNEENK